MSTADTPAQSGSLQVFTIGGAIEYGWRATWKNFWRFLLVAVIYVAINAAVSTVTGLVSPSDLDGQGMDALDMFTAASYSVLSIAASIVGFLVSAFLLLGLMRVALGVVKGNRVEVGEIFSFNGFGRYLLNSILIGIVMAVILAIVLVPTLLLTIATENVLWIALGGVLSVVLVVLISLAFTFFGYLILDKDSRGVSSLGASWALVRPHFWSILGLNLLVALIAVALIIGAVVAGVLMLVIGLLVTLPVAGVLAFGISTLSIAFAYRTISGEPVAN